MSDISDVIVAAISLLGTLCGSLGGILVSSKMTNYRIEQLEKKVDKHNGFAEKIPLINEQIKSLGKRLDRLERSNADEE